MTADHAFLSRPDDVASVSLFKVFHFAALFDICFDMAKDIKVSEVDFNSEFIARIIPKLDWITLWKAAESIGHVGELPQNLIEDYEKNEDFLKKVHHVLLEVEVINGDLLCPESGRKFPINDGIPNMLLNEDEV
ncbi:multifunctional methyltransferase subunit TRM112-like protein isoform X1 [Vespa crabro]|uniref:multifunctional methyltransferase subunit TRM112-like protein isoform X1 n=1 Tax=Vespa crabro TaxID=7445 RepID=UPI001F00165B|nr:multifunctional methyltransferase subunit TRM112-like protein isoform X1 [Vespa crabro]